MDNIPDFPHLPPIRPRLPVATEIAARYACDIALPNGKNRGLGDVLVLTPIVEQCARQLGRRIRLATAPLDIKVGTIWREVTYPTWAENPYIQQIVDISEGEANLLEEMHRELNHTTQLSHIIENTCLAFGYRPRVLKPQIYLTGEEQAEAIDRLSDFRRPLLCLHPSGKTSPKPDSPWHLDRWVELVERYKDKIGIIQIGKKDFDAKDIGAPCHETSIREMFATVWASDFFIGFDSAPMHVARSFDIPSLILWDAKIKVEAEERHCNGFAAAVLLRWGYAENRNIILLNEQKDDVANLVGTWVEEQRIRFQN